MQTYENTMNTSLMFIAAREGNIETLHKLLLDDPDILQRPSTTSSDTPLHIAAMHGHLGFVKVLIQRKTNFVEYAKELNQQGLSAIHLASANGHLEVVKELLEVSDELCNLKGKDGMTPLHCACIKARVETIRLLLSVSSATISEVTVRGETALHLAVKSNQFQALEILVEQLKQCNLLELINSKDEERNTILHLAAARRNRQDLELLLKCNISNPGLVLVNAMNESHLTPLDLVLLFPCDSTYDDIERLLKQAGAERARFLNGINLPPTQHNTEHQVSTRPEQKTLASSNSRSLSREDIIDWTDYFKFKLDTSSPDQARNALLVVAVLMATATYQACLSPPGGVKEGAPNEGISRIAISNPASYVLLMFFNSAGFYISMYIIFVLTADFPLYFELQSAVFAMSFTYAAAMGSLSPPGTKRAIFASLAVIMATFVPTVAFQIRKWYKKRRMVGPEHRRNQNLG